MSQSQQAQVPQTAAQQQSLQQQQAQQLVRPDDGELSSVVNQLEQVLASPSNQSQPAAAAASSSGDKKTDNNNKTASQILSELVAAEEAKSAGAAPAAAASLFSSLSDYIPAQFISAAKEHFAPEKLRLSDAAALAAKDEGNKLFTSQRFDEAVLAFTKAMLSVQSDQLYAVLLGNRSAAFVSSGMTLAAALDTEKSLSLKPESQQLRVKLLDRRARCLASLGESAAAEEDAALCKKLNELLQQKTEAEEKTNEKTDVIAALASAFDAVVIPSRSEILSAKQQRAIDQPWTFQELVKRQQNEDSATAAAAAFHADVRFSMDTQALPYSATQSFRRFASLSKKSTASVEEKKGGGGEEEEEKEKEVKEKGAEQDCGDILRETPAASAVRSDALLVVCAQCFRRSSALYPSEWHRKKFAADDSSSSSSSSVGGTGYRCRGVFCAEACSDLHWQMHGKREFGNSFFMAASADVVVAVRALRAAEAKQVVAVASAAADKLFSKLPEEVRPKFTLREEPPKPESTTAAPASPSAASASAPSLSWHIGANISLNAPRTQETEPVSQSGGAIFGGKESATALVGLMLGAFDSAKQAAAFVDTYRRVVAFLQPIVFVDRVFQSRNSNVGGGASASSSSAKGDTTTHATIPVVAGVGYYPLATLFNHSCDPNCHVVFHGMPFSTSATLHIRLLRPVHEGEMLTVAWHSAVNKTSNHSTRSRIQLLRRLYGFTCCCSFCSARPDLPLSKQKQDLMVKAADLYQKGRRLIRERRDLKDAIHVLTASLEILFDEVCPPPDEPIFVVAKTFDAIAQARMLQGDVAGALAYVKRRLEVLEKINGETNFEFVMELEKLAALIRTTCAASATNVATAAAVAGTVVDNAAEAEATLVTERAVRLLKRLYPDSVALRGEIAIVNAKE